MRIAITGALGHIGSHTIRNLGLKKLSQAVQVPLVKRPTKFIDFLNVEF